MSSCTVDTGLRNMKEDHSATGVNKRIRISALQRSVLAIARGWQPAH